MPYPFALPALPYEPAALEPHIDAQTMSIHHGITPKLAALPCTRLTRT